MGSREHDRWRVSLHGGHSGEFCDHGHGTLRDILEAAVEAGYRAFGVAEHAPRVEPRHLYAEERALGWDVAKIRADFARYAETLERLAGEFSDRIDVLRGFETEVVPHDRYAEITRGLREEYGFEYVVGSAHWVDDVIIDYTPEEFALAVTRQGGLEALAVRYYETVADMVGALRPEVVAHIDLVRKYGHPRSAVETPDVRWAAQAALEAVAECGAILDVNTAALRKGLGDPYPAPWIVNAARALGIGFCFGDDSHAPDQVGAGIDAARAYLLENGVRNVCVLTHGADGLVREDVSLE